MKFKVIGHKSEETNPDTVYLEYIHYDDYGYCTSFKAFYIGQRPDAEVIDLGYLKIGYLSLEQHVEAGVSKNGYNSYSVLDLMPKGYFDNLPASFFLLVKNFLITKQFLNH